MPPPAARAAPLARRDLDSTSPPSPSTPRRARDFDDAVSAETRGRRRAALDPHRRRRRPRAAGWRARPRGASARHQHLRAGGGRADASRGAERRRLQPGPGGRAARGDGRDRARRGRRASVGELLPQPHPLRRPARLRPARRVLRRPRPAAAGGRRAAGARPPRGRRARRAPRPAGSLEVESFEPEFELRRRRQRDRRPLGPPDGGPQADRAPDDPHQRAGRPAPGAAPRPDPLPGPRAARPAADRPSSSSSSPPWTCRRRRCPSGCRRARPASSRARSAAPWLARRRGAGTAGTRIHLSCFAP